MLHGGLGQMEDFNTITPALAGKFRLVGVDSRGHGRSTLGRNGLSYATLEDDLARIIDTLKLERFSILGFSDGANIPFIGKKRPFVRKNATVR